MKVLIQKAVALSIFVCLLFSAAPVSAANVNNFEISRYKIEYFLSKDADKRSTLKTVETITAVFPQIDQNHGIERAIPNRYDKHPTNLKVVSVTDERGGNIPYSTHETNSNTLLRIGEADVYVHGAKTYRITYTQRDVTKYFASSKADEFYWDTNGTEWAVPIRLLEVTLNIDDKLQPSMTGKQQCYEGSSGSSSRCGISGGDGVYRASASNLRPGENVTLAFGFEPDTFAAYEMPLSEKLFFIWNIISAMTFSVAVFLLIWFSVRYYHRSHRTKEIGTIIPEYLPPSSASVSTSGSISRKYGHVFSAQIIDLAVRHYLKIYQTREKSFFRRANYELEIVKNVDDLKEEELEVLRDIFDSLDVGTKLDMGSLRRNRSVGTKLSDNKRKLDKIITGDYKLRSPDKKHSAWYGRAAKYTLIAAILTLSPWLLIAAITGFVMKFTLKPLTDTGLALLRYLKGLEMYIETAESERIKILQSPEGASKQATPIDTNDKRQLVKLYERVLPYAILFGQEKEWNKRLGQMYESLNESPSWYAGHHGVFTAAAFSSSMGDFNTVASYSDPTNSSSGGSSGGGSSGGGGGGGGGGGW